MKHPLTAQSASPHNSAPASGDLRLHQGTREFRRANLAMFSAGLATFSLLYSVQPILPAFSRDFGVSPTQSSLVLSVCTATMAITLIVISSLSEAWGRRPVMVGSLAAASLLGTLAAFATSFHQFLFLRGLEGVALAGLPAVAMAWLSEEVHPSALGLAMGLYISGNAVGGMGGRILTSLLTGIISWRVGMGFIGAFSLLATVLFWRVLPPSRHFHRRPLSFSTLWHSLRNNLRDPGLLLLYCTGALLMGSFVTFFDYICYRLIAPPFHLSQTLVSWIFLMYITGIFSSTWMGALADRWGRRQVLWAGSAAMIAGALLTLPQNLPLVLVGTALWTFGFFGGHSIASSWVGRRAQTALAQASALYLLFYYFGSSVTSSAAGLVWQRRQWPGVIAVVVLLLLAALAIAFRLASVPPVSVSTAAPLQSLQPDRSPSRA